VLLSVGMHAEHIVELACPRCGGRIAGPDGSGWIDSGTLTCADCAAGYPIVGGVPRMVATAAKHGTARVGARTQAAFGFEWLRYPVTTPEEDRVTFFGLTGIEPSFHERVDFSGFPTGPPTDEDLAAAATSRLEGRKVLEAGCGMGKYVRVVSDLGARLAVGLDASDAVERAVTVTERRPNVLIVQGDIFHPPLAGGFDFAYSVGVLHHTPAPRRAFERVAALVRSGGELAVWLYPHSSRPGPYLLEFWHERLVRPLTSRLPHRVLERLCVGLGRLTVLKTRLRRRGGPIAGGIARALSAVAVGEHLDPGIAAFLNFDWYSPPHRSRHTDEELATWFGDAGYVDLRQLPIAVSAIARARRPSAPDVAVES
jgi:SAM-dependent methyltransferase/uncharacterized protein YbaR (Trm112 family)